MSKDKYIGLKLDFTDIYPVLNIPNPEDYKPYGIVIVKAKELITKKLEEVLTSLDELFTLTETTLAENDRIK